MIKGVSRQIIEVVDTGTEFFEKVQLFVKPEYSDRNVNSLRREAYGLLKDVNEQKNSAAIKQVVKSRHKKTSFSIKLKYFVVLLVLSFIVGAVVAKLFFT